MAFLWQRKRAVQLLHSPFFNNESYFSSTTVTPFSPSP